MGEFGDISASLVREWDDGFSVEFNLTEEDQYSLQEDMESFVRENDLIRD
jgi:hypothetical protein